jgi:hypothetical protein
MGIGQNAIGAKFNAAEAAPLFALGTVMWSDTGKAYVYCQANGAITGDGYVVAIDRTFQAIMLSTSNDAAGITVGVASTDFADNEYGWIQVYGPANVRVAASAAANAVLNTTGTAGQIDDDGTAASFDISGVILTTANGGTAGTAPGVLNWPAVAMVANS